MTTSPENNVLVHKNAVVHRNAWPDADPSPALEYSPLISKLHDGFLFRSTGEGFSAYHNVGIVRCQ